MQTIMRDIDYDSTSERPYECFNCGTIVIAETNPGRCPDCGNPMRNREMAIE